MKILCILSRRASSFKGKGTGGCTIRDLSILVLLLLGPAVQAQTLTQPARGVTDPGVVTTRQLVTPAGIQSIFDGRIYGIAYGQGNDHLWVL